ncbi:MAG: DUF296 domain-containing protein [Christensenellales bacterium]
MQTHTGSEYGRFVFMHLGKGDLILESIQQEVSRLGIQNGIVTSGIGSARKIVYHRIASVKDDPENEFITIRQPTEILALQGIIVDGEPHLHITCCDTKEAFGGHLEAGCEVQYLVEISILEVMGVDLVRRPDAFGIAQIQAR